MFLFYIPWKDLWFSGTFKEYKMGALAKNSSSSILYIYLIICCTLSTSCAVLDFNGWKDFEKKEKGFAFYKSFKDLNNSKIIVYFSNICFTGNEKGTFQDLLLARSLTDETASFVHPPPPPQLFFCLKCSLRFTTYILLPKADTTTPDVKKRAISTTKLKKRADFRELYWKNTVSQKTQNFIKQLSMLSTVSWRPQFAIHQIMLRRIIRSIHNNF